MTSPPRLLLAALVAAPLALLSVPGCDNAAAGSVDDLLTDARIARQQGRHAEAVRLLEQAYEAAPENAAVRAELGVSYLDREEIGLAEINRLARFLTDPPADAAPSPSPTTNLGATCPYADDPHATPFDPTSIEDYIELVGHRDLIEQVLAILHEGPGGDVPPVIPEALRAIGLCEGIEDGQLVYDRDGALAEMRALGLSDDQITAVLAANAVARLYDAYFFLTEDVPQQTTWYRVENGETSYIGVCADDEEALRAQAEEAIRDFGEALASLDLRAHVLGGDTPSVELVQAVIEAYESIRDDLGPYCGE